MMEQILGNKNLYHGKIGHSSSVDFHPVQAAEDKIFSTKNNCWNVYSNILQNLEN